MSQNEVYSQKCHNTQNLFHKKGPQAVLLNEKLYKRGGIVTMANVISEDKKTVKRPNNVILENRKMLLISGVTDVGSFDEQTVVVFTELGELTIKGTSLHVDRLNLEIGEIALSGKVYGLLYTDERPKGTGLISKIFR